MNWIDLNSEAQLETLCEKSHQKPALIFKHSTRCSISAMAKSRLERAGAIEGIDCYFLDLLAHRPLSNLIAEKFSVYHESPQVLVIRNGECSYDESHNGIDPQELREQLA